MLLEIYSCPLIRLDLICFHTSLWSTRLFLPWQHSTPSCRLGSEASQPQTGSSFAGLLLVMLLPVTEPLWAAQSHCRTVLSQNLKFNKMTDLNNVNSHFH